MQFSDVVKTHFLSNFQLFFRYNTQVFNHLKGVVQPLQPFLLLFPPFLWALMFTTAIFLMDERRKLPLKRRIKNRALFGTSSGLPVVCAGSASGNPEQTPEEHPNNARPNAPGGRTNPTQVRPWPLAGQAQARAGITAPVLGPCYQSRKKYRLDIAAPIPWFTN